MLCALFKQSGIFYLLGSSWNDYRFIHPNVITSLNAYIGQIFAAFGIVHAVFEHYIIAVLHKLNCDTCGYVQVEVVNFNFGCVVWSFA